MAERLQLVLQAGHVGRTRGATGSVGPLGTEQQFTLKTATYCQKWLTLRGWTCEVIGADEAVPDSHVFIAIHHDGSSNRDARGPSVGYPSDYRQRSENAAQEWKREFGKHYPGPTFRPDNYTSGLRGYYGYRKTNASIKLVCEHGFGSNLADARFMWSDEGQDAAMLAIEAVLGHWLGWDARKTQAQVHASLSGSAPAVTVQGPAKNVEVVTAAPDPIGPNTSPPSPRLLRHTSPPYTGGDVRALQQDLAAAGFDPGPVDGIFGQRTGAAVRAFQTHANLVVDGIAGPHTQHELAAALQYKSSRGTEQAQQPGSEGSEDEMPSSSNASGEAEAPRSGSEASPASTSAPASGEASGPPAGSGPATLHPVTDDVKQRAGHTAWQTAAAGAIIAALHALIPDLDTEALPGESELVAALTVGATLFSVVKTHLAGRRK